MERLLEIYRSFEKQCLYVEWRRQRFSSVGCGFFSKSFFYVILLMAARREIDLKLVKKRVQAKAQKFQSQVDSEEVTTRFDDLIK